MIKMLRNLNALEIHGENVLKKFKKEGIYEIVNQDYKEYKDIKI